MEVEIKKEGYIKKEEGEEGDEDAIYIKKEEDGTYVHPSVIKTTNKRQRVQCGPIDIESNVDRMNRGLSSLVSQYGASEQFNSINETNTKEIDRTIQEMENYVFHMHKEGEVSLSLFTYCNNVIEATRKWNAIITEQQKHMKDYVLNSIIYNKELHTMYTEMARRQQNKKDPTSPFNTMQTDIDTMTLNNDNGSITSIF